MNYGRTCLLCVRAARGCWKSKITLAIMCNKAIVTRFRGDKMKQYRVRPRDKVNLSKLEGLKMKFPEPGDNLDRVGVE